MFLEFLCFFYDPVYVGNLISGSSAFSNTNLNIWKFMVHVLLKPGVENFEHYFTSVWDEYNCAVIWAFFGTAFLRDWNENWPFPIMWPLMSFPNLLAYWVQHFHSIIFQDLKIAQLEFHHLYWLCSYWCFLRPTWLHIPQDHLITTCSETLIRYSLSKLPNMLSLRWSSCDECKSVKVIKPGHNHCGIPGKIFI